MASPSAHVLAHLDVLRETATLGPLLDLACGRGRNALALAGAGLEVVGLDRSAEQLAELRAAAGHEGLRIGLARADLEAAPHPPVARNRWGAVVVCRYLHRPLLPRLGELLRPGGWLLYETFTLRQRELGYGPRNPDFLLRPGELPSLAGGLEVKQHWEGLSDDSDRPEALARLAARRPG